VIEPPEGLRSIVSAVAKSNWLVNDKGYVVREFVSADEVSPWLKGNSLPVGYVAPDPRKTVTPVPALAVPKWWTDVVGMGMRFALQKKERAGQNEKGLLVIFSSTYGPVDHLYAERIKQAAALCKASGISVMALFPGKDETNASVAQFATRHSFDFPCAVDAGNAYADAVRAARTPEVFLLDEQLRVSYTGAIDDNTFGGEAAKPYLVNAIKELADGDVTTKPTRVFGTAIDR
jgi:hypothetical protein